jgi:hypothetical protein
MILYFSLFLTEIFRGMFITLQFYFFQGSVSLFSVISCKDSTSYVYVFLAGFNAAMCAKD